MPVNYATRVILGTAQFGLAYGATNAIGWIPDPEVERIIETAVDLGITTFDTAVNYGESEIRLGRLTRAQPGIDFISKLPTVAAVSFAQVPSLVRSMVEGSLERLGRSELKAVLLHRGVDLSTPQGLEAIAELQKLVTAGLIRELGVSIYDISELELALKYIDPPFRIQIPANVLDQRLITDQRLADPRIKVDIRSVLLQGVLLAPPEQIKSKLSRLAEPVRQVQLAAARVQLSLPQFLVGWALGHDWVDSVVMGVTSAAELLELLSPRSVQINPGDFTELRVDDVDLVDPRLWSPGLKLT